MRWQPLMPALAALCAFGCDHGTYILVNVESGTPLIVTALQVSETSGGQTGHGTYGRTSSSFSLPQSFVISLPDGRSGDATIEVVADSPTGELARASGKTTIIPRGTASLTIALLPSLGDMAMPTADMSIPPRVLAFASPVNSPAGNDAHSLAAGDFNGDKKLDLAVGDYKGLAVAVLLGNGDGTFLKPTILQASPVVAVTIADFDRDGQKDIATAALEGGAVNVFLGNGDGTFKPKATYGGIMGGGSGIVAADLNGDGWPDLAASDSFNNAVAVLENNGDGTFPVAKQFSVGQSPVAISAGDLNGDAKSDLVTANSNSDDLTVLINTGGAGAWSFKSTTFKTGKHPNTIVIADFNGDRHLDVAAGSTVLLGDGAGGLRMPIPLLVVASGAGDLDGDGRIDLIDIGDQTNPKLSVALGLGDGAFLSPKDFTLSFAAVAAIVGDANGDGLPDVAIANGTENSVTVLINISK